MKNKVSKLLGLTIFVLFCTACEEKDPEFSEQLLFNSYLTESVESSTNSYVQVADSIHYFSQIRGHYSSYRGRLNKNVFSLHLKSPNFQFPNNFDLNIGILTETMKPESFFQKGVRKIDSMCIERNFHPIGNLPRIEYYRTQSLLTWDTVFYENGIFRGKGLLEILETMYSGEDGVFYPPQKIEFEFK